MLFRSGELSIISYEDNRSLIQYFGKWENIKVKLPAIAEVIGAMAGKDHIMVAKMDSYVKDLIDRESIDSPLISREKYYQQFAMQMDLLNR